MLQLMLSKVMPPNAQSVLRPRVRQLPDGRLFNWVFQFAGGKTIHCLGDSHTRVFEYIASEYLWSGTRFRFCIVPGATAMGIPNPSSQTQAGPVFMDYLKEVASNHYILACLGEVDCGFVIWYRARKYGDPVEEQLGKAIKNYLGLLEVFKESGRRNLIVCSAALPTIRDGQTGEVALLRKEVKASLRERTDLTIRFNKYLRNYCERNSHIFLDLETHTLNKATMLVDERFVSPNQSDHHLYAPALADYIVAELKKNGFH